MRVVPERKELERGGRQMYVLPSAAGTVIKHLRRIHPSSPGVQVSGFISY